MSADEPSSGSGSPTSVRVRGRSAVTARRVLGGLASLVRLVCWLIALLMVLYLVLVWGNANPANGWTIVVTEWAHRLNLGLGNLFSPPDPRIALTINYLIATAVWLLAGSLAYRLIRRI